MATQSPSSLIRPVQQPQVIAGSKTTVGQPLSGRATTSTVPQKRDLHEYLADEHVGLSMFAHDYYTLAATTMDTPLREVASFGTCNLAEPPDYMDSDKLTITTALLQTRYPGASMAAIFHHALEVAMYFSAGSPENRATAWPFLDMMCQAFAGQNAIIRALQTKITTLEDAAIAAGIAKAAAEVTKAAEVKAAVESATKDLRKRIQELESKAVEVKAADLAARTSNMKTSREHLVGLVVSKTILKHFLGREMKKWELGDVGASTDAASKVLVGLLDTNVDTSARLCGTSSSDVVTLQQHANKLVELVQSPTTMDITRLVEDVSTALPSRPRNVAPTPAATGPGNSASTAITGKLSPLPRALTSPFKRLASSHFNQASGLDSPLAAQNALVTSLSYEPAKQNSSLSWMRLHSSSSLPRTQNATLQSVEEHAVPALDTKDADMSVDQLRAGSVANIISIPNVTNGNSTVPTTINLGAHGFLGIMAFHTTPTVTSTVDSATASGATNFGDAASPHMEHVLWIEEEGTGVWKDIRLLPPTTQVLLDTAWNNAFLAKERIASKWRTLMKLCNREYHYSVRGTCVGNHVISNGKMPMRFDDPSRTDRACKTCDRGKRPCAIFVKPDPAGAIKIGWYPRSDQMRRGRTWRDSEYWVG